MPKLFVAIDLPLSVTSELARIQPSPQVGLRLAAAEQMHLTLHFIGEAEIRPMIDALKTVEDRTLELTIQGVGSFSVAGGAVVLWAGVKMTPDLLRLHADVASSLAGLGFRPETRKYAPHITLARCGPEVRAGLVDEFLASRSDLSLPPTTIDGFSLYSSVFEGGVPRYQREASFLNARL